MLKAKLLIVQVLVLSLLCTASASAPLDTDASEIADLVSMAYQSETAYRSVPREAYFAQAQAKAAEVLSRIEQTKPIERKFIPQPAKVLGRILLTVGPLVIGIIRDVAVYGFTEQLQVASQHHQLWGHYGFYWALGLFIVIPELRESHRALVMDFPGRIVNGIKSSAANLSSGLRVQYNLKEFQKKIVEELRKRNIPVDASHTLCASLLSKEPMVRIETAENPDINSEVELADLEPVSESKKLYMKR